MNKHIRLLGKKATDRITGFKGVVSTVSFDLYGCIQAVLSPQVCEEDGKPRDGRWFDVSRLDIADADRVMPIPNYEHGQVADGGKGPAEKPPL